MGPHPEADLVLFTHPHSRYSQRARIGLVEKGIPYTSIDIDFSNKPKLLLESNPINQTVPTIIHKGRPVSESLIVLEYLEDEWPHQVPLLPQDAFEKSKMRFWADYLYKSWDTFLNPIGSKLGYSSVDLQAAYEETITVLKTLEAAMAAYSTTGPWFTGETFGFLDVVMVPLVNTLFLVETLAGFVLPGPNEIPRVHKWIEAISERPSYRAQIPNKEETLAVYKPIFDRKAAAAAAAAK